MYETKIIIPSRKGQGLVGLSVGDEGPSVVDRATNVAIGLLVVVLLYTLFDPFSSSAAGDEHLARLDTIFTRLAETIVTHEKAKGPYTATSCQELTGDGVDELSNDPWGHPLVIDPFFKRVISTGPNGKLDTVVPELGNASTPDGDDRIHFYRPRGSLWYAVKTDEGNVVVRATVDGVVRTPFRPEGLADLRDPDQTADGRRVTVSVETAGTGRQIAVVPVTGGTAEFVTTVGENRWPSWTADGAAVVYESQRSGAGHDYQLYLYTDALRREQPVTQGATGFRTPRCHPTDPGQVACVGLAAGQPPRIYVVPTEPTNETLRPLNTSSRPEKSPAWYRDGKHLAFIAKDGKRLVLCRVNVHNRQVTNLPDVGGQPVSVDCSPYDDSVVVVRKNDDGTCALVVVGADGGRQVPVVVTGDAISSVRWTP